MPNVSVILPVYNGDQFLAESVESVLAQTVDDWELIIINDGSTDKTKEVIQSFTDPRIKVVHQSNQGAAAARNHGLQLATGEYIAFLDADDLYLENAFADCLHLFAEQPTVDALFADGYVCDRNKNPLMSLRELRSEIYTGNILEQELLDPHVVSFPVCTMTYHSVIQQNQLQFDRGLTPSEDWDFWIQVARFAHFGYLNKPICIYRLHDTNITNITNRGQRRQDLINGRMKIMQSDWFTPLSTTTKERFFQYLCFSLLRNDIVQQKNVLNHHAFLAMPYKSQAIIMRLIASDYLVKGQEITFAKQCLQQAVTLDGTNKKGVWLLNLVNFSPRICSVLLRQWQKILTFKRQFQPHHQQTPKSLPYNLDLV